MAVIRFAPLAHGSTKQLAYTDQLDLSEPPIAFVQAVSSLPIKPPGASVVPQVKRKGMNQDNQLLGESLAIVNGIEGQEWECLDTLWGQNESGWFATAQNKVTSAFGIAQFLDSTWLGTGFKKSSDPEIQIKAGLVYIKNRYQTPCKALQFQVSHVPNWY